MFSQMLYVHLYMFGNNLLIFMKHFVINSIFILKDIKSLLRLNLGVFEIDATFV